MASVTSASFSVSTFVAKKKFITNVFASVNGYCDIGVEIRQYLFCWRGCGRTNCLLLMHCFSPLFVYGSVYRLTTAAVAVAINLVTRVFFASFL